METVKINVNEDDPQKLMESLRIKDESILNEEPAKTEKTPEEIQAEAEKQKQLLDEQKAKLEEEKKAFESEVNLENEQSKATEVENKETVTFDDLLEQDAKQAEIDEELALLKEIKETGTLDFFKKAKALNKSIVEVAQEHKTVDIDSLTEEDLFTAKFQKLGWDKEKIAEQYEIFSERPEYEKAPLLNEVKGELAKFNEEQIAKAKSPFAQNTQQNNETLQKGLQDLTSALKEKIGQTEDGVLFTNKLAHSMYKEGVANPYFKPNGELDIEKTIKHAKIEVAERIIVSKAKQEGKQEALKEVLTATKMPSLNSPKNSISEVGEGLNAKTIQLLKEVTERNENPYGNIKQ